MADQPLSRPAGTRFHEGKRPPRALGVIGVGVVVALLVTVYGTFRWGWTWTGYQDNATLWNWLKLVLLPVTIALLPLWLRSREQRKAHWRVGFALVALALAVLAVGGYRWHWGWTGFNGKKLWDWLEVFLVPFALPAVLAWATTPPPAPTPDERVPPDQPRPRRPGTAGPAAGVLVTPQAEASAGTRSHASAPAAPAEPDAPDPGVDLATRHLAAPLPTQPRSSAAATEVGLANPTPPTQPQADLAKPLPTARSAQPPADQRPAGRESGTGGIAPAHSAAARLVQAHPALTIAISLVVVGLLTIAALLPGRAPPAPTATTHTVTVTSNKNWTDTGIYLTKGERVTITASGTVDPDGPHGPSPPVGPEGNGQ